MVAMETFCETVQFYLKHLEDSVYPVMTEDQFALKLFPMYRYFVTVWLRNHNPEVRHALLRGLPSPRLAAPQPVGRAGPRCHCVQPCSQTTRETGPERGQSWELAMLSALGPWHLRKPAWWRPQALPGRAVLPVCRCSLLPGCFTCGSSFHASSML